MACKFFFFPSIAKSPGYFMSNMCTAYFVRRGCHYQYCLYISKIRQLSKRLGNACKANFTINSSLKFM